MSQQSDNNQIIDLNPHHHYSNETNLTQTLINSNTAVADDDDDETVKNIIVIIFYSLIVCVSLCGNSLVLRVVFAKKKMRTTTNIFIGCLAFSDILTTTLNIPFNVARFLLYNWPFGRIFCILVPFVQVSCVYVSTITMAVIAIHRWWTLSKRSSGSKSIPYLKLVLIILVTWSIAGVLALPHSMFNEIVPAEYKNQTYIRCRVVYPRIEFDFKFWLSIEAFLTQYLIPLSIISILYIKIGFVVSKQGHLAGKTSDERKRRQSEARRRRIIMLVLVVAAFAACWLPVNLHHLLVDFKIIRPNVNVFYVCHWIAMSSVCYNPFIYCWLNESFRKGAAKLFRIICWCCYGTNNSHEPIEDINTINTGNEMRLNECKGKTCDENETKLTQV